MKNDNISRQAAIDADAEIAPMLIGERVHFENVTFKHDIEQVSRIEAEPVKHAHVVWTESNTSHKTQCCSNCHRTFISRPDETIEFCPHCGAKIDDHEGELK